MSLAIEEIDVRFVHQAEVLHCIAQVCRFRERLGTLDSLRFEKHDDFVGRLAAALRPGGRADGTIWEKFTAQ